MHLTRIVPNVRNHAARRDLANPADMHKTLWCLVPEGLGDTPRADYGLLWRMDRVDTGSVILVQTALEPRPAQLPDGWASRIETRDLTPLLEWLRDGRPVRYRIAINPVRVENATRRRVVVPVSEVNEWWQPRCTRAGLANLDSPIIAAEPTRVTRRDGARFSTAVTRIDGTATIVDHDALRSALENGIGRAKAWGCGLLTIAPARG